MKKVAFCLLCAIVLLAACGNGYEDASDDVQPVSVDAGAGADADAPDVADDAPADAPVTDAPQTAASVFYFPFDFDAHDLYGNPVNAQSLGEREAFFVYLWATWCTSCVVGMPGLAELALQFGDRVGFMTLLGDFDTGQSAAINITESAGAPFITVDAFHEDLYDVFHMANSGFVPTSVLIGADGRVIGQQIVGSDSAAFLAAIERALAQ